MAGIVWLIHNLVPYHHARFVDFAILFDGEAHVVQVTNKDSFEILEYSPETTPYQLHTLFKGRKYSCVGWREMYRAVSDLFAQLEPDCVCVGGWGLMIGQVALLAACEARLPIVLCSDSNEFDEKRTWYKEAFKSRIITACSAFFVAGSSAQSYIRLLGGGESFVGYDVVDNDHFFGKGEFPLGLPANLQGTNWFFACARFGEKKNLLRLIEAHAEYLKECEREGVAGYRLVIAGDGELREEIESTIRRHRLDDEVELLGAVNYDSLPWLYQHCRAYIQASTTEQWGLVVNEAMAAGAPVLLSNRCGCALDLVCEGKNGFLFSPYEIAGIVAVLWRFHSLSGTERREFSEKSVSIIKEWSPDRFATGLNGAIGRAMENGPKKNTYIARLLLRMILAKR